MKDYAQYSTRIPSPNFKRSSGVSTATTSPAASVASANTSTWSSRNTSSHSLISTSKILFRQEQPDKREKDSDSPSRSSQGSARQSVAAGSATTTAAAAAVSVPSNGYSPPPMVNTNNATTTLSSSSPSSQHYYNTQSTQHHNAEQTIQRLKEQLKEAMARDDTAKSALAKSDQVILDLRYEQRQLKRQLDALRQEQQQQKEEARSISGSNNSHHPHDDPEQEQKIQSLQAQIQELTQQLLQSSNHDHHNNHNNNNDNQDFFKDEKVGELQVQLDRAHAQILTADMVRRELEDTLEAEQYTWELRMQDQERRFVSLQQECESLAQDLDHCREQWKESEQAWCRQLEQLREELELSQARFSSNENNSELVNHQNIDNTMLMKKIHQLETERTELQSCLDEALKELEAVDAELRTEDGSKLNNSNNSNNKSDKYTVESLQHLLRWIYQEGPVEKRLNTSQLSEQTSVKELVAEIQGALDEWLDIISRQKEGTKSRDDMADNEEREATMDDLQKQIQDQEEELKIWEESSEELRESLKEAVALLKPMQDAVAQAEEEKMQLQQQLEDLEKDHKSTQEEASQRAKQIETLQEQVTSLEEQLEDQKRISQARETLLAATPSPNKSRSVPSNPPGDEEDSIAKIQRAREELRRKRETEINLQKLLKDAQSRFKNLHQQNENVTAKNRELQGRIEMLGEGEDQNNISTESELSAMLAQREAEVQSMQEQLEQLQRSVEDPSDAEKKIKSLEETLQATRGELAQREQAERILNKSLKEALGLLKPLQMHLEEAEQEKMEISKELRNLRKRFRQLQMGEGDDFSGSTMGGHDVSVELIKIKDELEETVRQLEMENSQLHDALEDLTEDGNKHQEAKIRQQLVELNSRYEVTQNKLEDSHVENHALVKRLKQMEVEDMKRKDEIARLREKIQHTETELHNAKSIAKSALVKVEELTMSSIEHLSREGPLDLSLEGMGQLSEFSF